MSGVFQLNSLGNTATGSNGFIFALYKPFRASTVWTCPFDGWLKIRAIGGGGSGAGASNGRATGGGAGECGYKIMKVKAGDIFTIGVAAGGAASIAVANGNQGGTTYISGPNIEANVGGGYGGNNGANNFGVALAGGSGGYGGSGFDYHFQGGRGGNMIANSSSFAGTGGGAVNILGLTAQTATRGGDLLFANSGYYHYTGGGGVGGTGGDVTTSLDAHPSTAGGGSGSSAEPNIMTATSAGLNYALNRLQATAFPSEIELGLDFTGGGGYHDGVSTVIVAGPGGGGAAGGGNGGNFAGGGGGGGSGGGGGYGGGGGGIFKSTTGWTGPGGQGMLEVWIYRSL